MGLCHTGRRRSTISLGGWVYIPEIGKFELSTLRQQQYHKLKEQFRDRQLGRFSMEQDKDSNFFKSTVKLLAEEANERFAPEQPKSKSPAPTAVPPTQ